MIIDVFAREVYSMVGAAAMLCGPQRELMGCIAILYRIRIDTYSTVYQY